MGERLERVREKVGGRLSGKFRWEVGWIRGERLVGSEGRLYELEGGFGWVGVKLGGRWVGG